MESDGDRIEGSEIQSSRPASTLGLSLEMTQRIQINTSTLLLQCGLEIEIMLQNYSSTFDSFYLEVAQISVLKEGRDFVSCPKDQHAIKELT